MSSDQIENAWKSIQNMLIQNRCWICEQVFARGKTKKVFMVSHLLKYLEDRWNYLLTYRMSAEALSGVNAATAPTSSIRAIEKEVEASPSALAPSPSPQEEALPAPQSTVPLPLPLPLPLLADSFAPMRKELLSKNLRNCWFAFRTLHGDKDEVASALQRVDCEVWMSGLICARSKACAEEYLLLVPDGKVSSAIMSQADGGAMFDADGYSKTRKGDVFVDKNGNVCPPGCDCDNPWQYIQAALMKSENSDLTIPGDAALEQDKDEVGEAEGEDEDAGGGEKVGGGV
jgi:hypothetical protein